MTKITQEHEKKKITRIR